VLSHASAQGGPEGRNGHARQGEAIKDRWVGASDVVLPLVGIL
jgi:hypothetical protein